MNKKGSHIGVMLSFIIFLFFLIFLFVVLEPAINLQKSKQPALNSLEIELMNNLSIDVDTITISTQAPVTLCTNLLNADFIPGSNLIVKNSVGDTVGYEKSGNLEIDDDGDFFKIYYSNSFIDSQTSLSCGELTRNVNYSVGLIETNKYIYNESVGQLIIEYLTNYEDLKNQLKIIGGDEFSFSFIHSDGTELKAPSKNVSTNIYTKETSVQYIDSQGNILLGTLRTRIW